MEQRLGLFRAASPDFLLRKMQEDASDLCNMLGFSSVGATDGFIKILETVQHEFTWFRIDPDFGLRNFGRIVYSEE